MTDTITSSATILDDPAIGTLRAQAAGKAVVIDLPQATAITCAGYLALLAWGRGAGAAGQAVVLAIHRGDLWAQVRDLHLDQVVGCVSRLPPPVALHLPGAREAAAAAAAAAKSAHDSASPAASPGTTP